MGMRLKRVLWERWEIKDGMKIDFCFGIKQKLFGIRINNKNPQMTLNFTHHDMIFFFYKMFPLVI
jgi:hypothetical protein